MGSSMGALISLYAISEYPNIFYGAACLSTNWPAGEQDLVTEMAHTLPDPKSINFISILGRKASTRSLNPVKYKWMNIFVKGVTQIKIG